MFVCDHHLLHGRSAPHSRCFLRQPVWSGAERVDGAIPGAAAGGGIHEPQDSTGERVWGAHVMVLLMVVLHDVLVIKQAHTAA